MLVDVANAVTTLSTTPVRHSPRHPRPPRPSSLRAPLVAVNLLSNRIKRAYYDAEATGITPGAMSGKTITALCPCAAPEANQVLAAIVLTPQRAPYLFIALEVLTSLRDNPVARRLPRAITELTHWAKQRQMRAALPMLAVACAALGSNLLQISDTTDTSVDLTALVDAMANMLLALPM